MNIIRPMCSNYNIPCSRFCKLPDLNLPVVIVDGGHIFIEANARIPGRVPHVITPLTDLIGSLGDYSVKL